MKKIEMTIVRGGKKTKNLTKKSTNQNQNSSSKKSNQNSGSLIVWIHIKNRLWKKVGVRKKTLKIIMQPLSRADRSCFRSLRTVGRSKNLRGAKISFRLYLSVSVLFYNPEKSRGGGKISPLSDGPRRHEPPIHHTLFLNLCALACSIISAVPAESIYYHSPYTLYDFWGNYPKNISMNLWNYHISSSSFITLLFYWSYFLPLVAFFWPLSLYLDWNENG